MFEHVEVFRGGYKGDANKLFGPLPGLRQNDVLAYEFELPTEFVPWPDRTRLERTFVLLELGISLSQPCWQHMLRSDGSRVPGVDSESDGDRSWYVDLVEVQGGPHQYEIRDMYVDVIVAGDGRGHRMLDFDEIADALDASTLSTRQVVDGLRRWQRFLDRHLYWRRDPSHGWRDFPPRSLKALAAVPEPIGSTVTWRAE